MSAVSTELRLSLAIALGVTILYFLIAQNGIPGSSSVIGYGLGILGFLLMLGAEVLHTWRKQQKDARWGKMRTWLQAHVVIGLVGPYLVLLHSAWRLNGVAGVVMLLTFLMVASGFLCYYIYPALPRNVEGAELSLPEVEAQIAETQEKLQVWETEHPAAVALLGEGLENLSAIARSDDVMSVLGRTFLRLSHERQVREALQKLQTAGITEAKELEQLLNRRYILQTQVQSLATARKLLSRSRTFHIVLGVVLFALAFVHIGAALYYATFAH